MTSTATTPNPNDRIERLSVASVRKVLEPEELFDWSELGPGRVIGDDLLSVSGLDLDLTPEQRARLSREEVAAQLRMGIRFEAVLNAGFSLQVADAEPRDPRVTYMLHEIGEETRHQRAFVRLVEELRPTARNPLDRPLPRRVARAGIRQFLRMPALLMVLVLAGEEIPDLLQRLAAEHPDKTVVSLDPLVCPCSTMNRIDEPHLAWVLEELVEGRLVNPIRVDAETAEGARVALQRMLDIT
jgi:hypothetical protein